MKRFLRFAVLMVALVALNVPFVSGVLAAGSPAGGGTDAGSPAGAGTDATSESSGGLTNPLNNINSLPEFMNAILDAVIQIGTIVLTLAIVYVGFLFVQAQGNEEKIKSARSALLWTVIGGLVLLGAKTVGLVISSTIGAL
ncbi:MAG: hypothetical protein KA104_01535 [Candidatus Pacebacteria bacterium]|nr:hypothetical protein [Candidatus Paceibacterota bacterium]